MAKQKPADKKVKSVSVYVKQSDGTYKEVNIDKILKKMELKNLPTENHFIEHIFTEEELKSKSQQLANAVGLKQNDEDSKKQVVSEFKAKIDSHQSNINLLSKHINNGSERRNEDVYVMKDFSLNEKIFFSLSSKKEVGREKLTEADYQAELPLEMPEAE